MSEQVIYRTLFSMGTRMDIILMGISDEQGDLVFSQIKNELERLDNILSIHNKASVFSDLNENACKREISIQTELSELLKSLIDSNEKTLGLFDFTLGYQTELDEIEKEYLDIPFKERVTLNMESNTILFNTPLMKLDSGGFGKGYALDKIKIILKNNKINDAFISFGGSSVLGAGTHSAGDHWPVGIQDFTNNKQNMHVIKLKDQCLSSSGNTANNISKHDKGHIIDPKTGDIHSRLELVSVYGESAFIAEILSTALFIANDKESLEILNNFRAYKAVRFLFDNKSGKVTTLEYN